MSTTLTYTFGVNAAVSASTAEVLAAGLPADAASVKIRALSTNTGKIYVGNSDVTTAAGFELSAGDTWVSIGDYKTRIDASALYVISSVDGEDVRYEIAEYGS